MIVGKRNIEYSQVEAVRQLDLNDEERRMKRSLYEELAERFVRKIDKEEWTVGMRVPGEIELARMYGVGRSTIRETLNLLWQRGLVEKRNGVGTFIKSKDPKLENPLLELTSLGQMITEAGFAPQSVGFKKEILPPSPELAEIFSLDEGDMVTLISRGRLAGETPVAYSYNIFPEKEVGDMFDGGFSGRMLIELEKKGIKIKYADTEIKGISPDNIYADRALKFLGSSAVLLKQLHYDERGRAIFLSYDYLNTDIMKLNIRRTKKFEKSFVEENYEKENL